ncbi:phosphoglycerate dehydrogenase [Pueribacillus theae]|uniref:D-3-phosphoglycerate dehydrogenase n=1 Tax=Pueribacillus theae TaxID=2171751 RepID=A0A2U1K5C5_9BACI|nr:phosphoglycerate dehydrogenase [Pueribacillus theae]PWA12404.1 phosphoglycerate dehydrogenase [Pueribacillus theae]
MFYVLASDPMSEDGLQPLLNNDQFTCVQKHVNDEDNLEQYDALLVRSGTKVTEEVMEKMPNLKIIARAGVGVDNIDIDAATKRGIVVINAPDGNTISTCEHTFTMIASLARMIPQATQSIKSGKWERKAFLGMELRGKNLGIVGFGRIGSELAVRARAFGMNLYVYDPFLTNERAKQLGVTVNTLDEVLENADIITVHTPLTKDTKGLIGHHNIEKTKRGVLLINCARGGIIDEEALLHYLKNGHVGGAAFDVFEHEPPGDNPLLELDNFIATPHIAASTKEAQLNVAAQVSEEVVQFLQGHPIKNSINLPTMSDELFEKIQPYYQLTKTMGSILSQCMNVPVKEIEVTYAGDITKLETSVITRSLLAGFLTPRADTPVNEVNSPTIAKERGIVYGEKHTERSKGYSNLIDVNVIGENTNFTMQATYVKEYGPRIVNLNGFDIDFYPHGHLLYIQHIDKPGIIGQVGQILGDHNMNIATMQVGRKEAGGEAIMMLSFDDVLSDEAFNALKEIKDITSIKKID